MADNKKTTDEKTVAPPPKDVAPVKTDDEKLAELTAPDNLEGIEAARASAIAQADSAMAEARARAAEDAKLKAREATGAPDAVLDGSAQLTPSLLNGLTPAQLRAIALILEGKPSTEAEGLATAGATASAYNTARNLPSEEEALRAASGATPGPESRPMTAQDILVRVIKGKSVEIARMGNRTYTLDPNSRKPIYMLRSHALELAQTGWVVPLQLVEATRFNRTGRASARLSCNRRPSCSELSIS